MIISDEENKTITFANCRCITINIVDCRRITLNMADIKEASVHMADSKNFDICIAGCSSYGIYEEKSNSRARSRSSEQPVYIPKA